MKKNEQTNGIETRYFKVENAARMIDVSPWTIRKWIRQRKLRIYRFGGAVRIREADLMAFATVRPGNRISEISLESDGKSN